MLRWAALGQLGPRYLPIGLCSIGLYSIGLYSLVVSTKAFQSSCVVTWMRQGTVQQSVQQCNARAHTHTCRNGDSTSTTEILDRPPEVGVLGLQCTQHARRVCLACADGDGGYTGAEGQ